MVHVSCILVQLIELQPNHADMADLVNWEWKEYLG